MNRNHSKKHIVHLIPSLGNGGCENMLLATIPELTHYTHTVVTLGEAGSLAPLFEQRHIPVVSLNQTLTLSPVTYIRLFRLLRRLKPHGVVTYLPAADLIGRLIAHAAGIHNVICSIRAHLKVSGYWPLFILDGLTSFLVSHYHFNSATVAESYRRYLHVPKRKMTIIPNGVVLSDAHVDQHHFRRSLGLSDQHTIITCIGHFRPQKGHRYLIPAFARVIRRHPNAILLLVGAGPELLSIKQAIRQSGVNTHVYLLGNRYDVPDILAASDIFILPTLYEGMSKVILEAAQRAKPIITTNIPENREVITTHYTGLLVPPRDTEALAQAMLKLIVHPTLARLLSENAQKEITRRFPISLVINQLHQFFFHHV